MRYLVLLLVITVLTGCSATRNITDVEGCVKGYEYRRLKAVKDFEVGRVSVGFDSGITENEAERIIQNYGFEFKSHFTRSVGYIVEVLKGHPSDYIEHLQSSKMIISATWIGQPPKGKPGKLYVVVSVNHDANLDDVHNFINSIDGLKIDDELTVKESVLGEVIVPEGKEFEWSCKLDKDLDIRWAVPIYISSLEPL